MYNITQSRHRFEQRCSESTNSPNAGLSALFQKIKKKHKEVYVILAPPRCSSTAFARVFWEHSSIGFYCHEPFDAMYHRDLDLSYALKTLEHPLNLEKIKKNSHVKNNGLAIKEMTFQVGQNFQILASITKNPLIFIIRDPRLSIFSKMQKLREGNKNPIFSIRESGWISLNLQIEQCKAADFPYLIVDSSDFRNSPQIIFKKVFEKLGLVFSNSMLSWQPVEDIELGNLGVDQNHWYQRVLISKSIQSTNEPVPEINSFPETNGFREQVKKYLEVYETLRNDVNIVIP